MPDSNELETWTDFIHSDGWRLFTERCQREWGPSGLRFQQSVREAAAKKDGAAEELRMILLVQEQLVSLLAYPKERWDALRNQRKTELSIAAPSRRGPGL